LGGAEYSNLICETDGIKISDPAVGNAFFHLNEIFTSVTSRAAHLCLVLHSITPHIYLDQGSFSVRSLSTMSAPNSKAFPLANAQLTNQVRRIAEL
jgi:hypothetical protein